MSDNIQELRNKRIEILQELKRLQDGAKIFLVLDDDAIMKKMESMRDSKALIKFLADEADVSIYNLKMYNLLFIINIFLIIFCILVSNRNDGRYSKTCKI
jgi:hypothetical protein